MALGVADQGVFSDLDRRAQLDLPGGLTPERVQAVVDPGHDLLVLHAEHQPVKVYPLTGARSLAASGIDLERLVRALRPGDRGELAPLLTAGNVRALGDDAVPAPGDADGDGIPDPLDVLVGGKKTVLNGARYGAGYIAIAYPMGDVPRDKGVCTDVIIRAVRNAGIDLQRELHRDIRRAQRAYPMVEGRGNRNIDHRRVRTLLPYFKRHWDRRSAALDDPDDPLRPGDVVLMDTLPQNGPDHIGIVSNRAGESGHPLIINNWTDGHVTAEMDLLAWVPVTHRFRFPSARTRR